MRAKISKMLIAWKLGDNDWVYGDGLCKSAFWGYHIVEFMAINQ